VLAAPTTPASLGETLQHVHPDFGQVDDVLKQLLDVEDRFPAAWAAVESRLHRLVDVLRPLPERPLVARLPPGLLLVLLLRFPAKEMRLARKIHGAGS
jgi:hypothetical protein